MSITATTAEELGKALKNDESEITIEGDLEKKVIRIKVAGKVAWAIAGGAIACAVIATIAAVGSGGTAAPVAVPTAFIGATAATGVLGVGATTTAIAIAVAAGGFASLSKLRRNYRLEKRDGKSILIKK
jgi:hypothetical protein